jgi:hypothetical protein
MYKPSRRFVAALGSVAIAGTTGLVALAPAATAATVTPNVKCTNALGDTLGTQSYTLTLAPDTGLPGGSTTATFDAGVTPIISPLEIKDAKVRTTVTLEMSGAATGTVDITSPEEIITIPANVGADANPFDAQLAIPPGLSAGTIDFKIVKLVQNAQTIFGPQVSTCVPTGNNGVIAGYTVQEAPKTPVVTRITPNHAQLPADVAVEAANFTPNAAATIVGLDAGMTPTGDTAAVTVGADGKVSGTISITKENTRFITVSEGAPPAKNANPVAFRVDPAAGGGLQQNGEGDVLPGTLAMQQSAAGFKLTPVTLNGKPQNMTGALNTVSVQDFRGGTGGWSLTGTITDFTSDTGGTIPADRFTWTPNCTVTNPDSPSTVNQGSAGPVVADASGKGATLCSQDAKGPGQVTGGEFAADAEVKLAVPAFQLAGTYNAILTLTLA